MSSYNASIVYAGPEEEFFYKDNDLAVTEGDIIGIDLDVGDEVHLVLLEDVYWVGTEAHNQ